MTGCRGALAAVGLCVLLAAGCAAGDVIATDREALWTACLQALGEQGFEVVSADETKGEIRAASVSGRAEPAGELRATVSLYRLDGEPEAAARYSARVIVHRPPARSELPTIESAVRYQHGRPAGAGRTMTDYGTVPTRDYPREQRIRDRIRDLLSSQAAPGP